jgi:hypothetical protein
MSLTLTVNIDAAAVSATMEAIAAAMVDKEGLHGAAAESVLEATRDHLEAKYVPRNKRGDFWADVRDSLEATATDSHGTVTMQELGLPLRFFGGEVTPGKSISSYTGELTRALAIPSDKVPVVDGRQIRPGRAGILAFIRSRSPGETVGFLVEGELRKITSGPNKGKDRTVRKTGGDLLYTLRTITRHKPDPGILPSDEELTEAAVEGIGAFVKAFE